MGARIRAHDWAATPLGPIETWPPSLRTAVDLLLAARQPVYVAWGPDLTSLYNDSYIPILGAKHPGGLGQPYADLFAEIWDEYRPLMEATLAGEAQYFVDRPVPLAGRGAERPLSYFTFSWTPLRDATGRVAGFYCAATETTETVRAAAALRASEARFRSFAESSADTLWIVDAATGQLEFLSPAFERLWGEPRDAVLRDLGRWADLVHPADRDRAADFMPRVLAGETVVVDYRIVRPADEGVRWIRDTGFPIRDERGRVARVAGIAQDISDQKESEERQAFLLRLSDALRPLADPVAIQDTATHILGAHLAVDRCTGSPAHPRIATATSDARMRRGASTAPNATPIAILRPIVTNLVFPHFIKCVHDPGIACQTQTLLCFEEHLCTQGKNKLHIPQCKEELQIRARRDISGNGSQLARHNRFSRSGMRPFGRSSVQTNGPILFLGAKFNCKKRRATGDDRRVPGVE
jgi:PAS domain S-box-containing protein